MTSLLPFSRALALCALGSLVGGGAHAQASWDLDSCTPGTKTAALYDNCGGTGAGVSGVTVDVRAYQTGSSSSNFFGASINNGGSYIGVLSGGEDGSASPHHAIDNVHGANTPTAAWGRSYELVHLAFSAAVDLSNVTANWVNDTGGDADYQVYRWDVNAGTPDPTITNFNPDTMTGWSLVSSSDFSIGGLSQAVSDGVYFSSHWLITTAFGGNNDAFKLGVVKALNVCTGANVVNPTGACVPDTTPGVPEPATLAMVLLAGLGIRSVRRPQRQA